MSILGWKDGQLSSCAIAQKKQRQVNNPASNISNQLQARKRLEGIYFISPELVPYALLA